MSQYLPFTQLSLAWAVHLLWPAQVCHKLLTKLVGFLLMSFFELRFVNELLSRDTCYSNQSVWPLGDAKSIQVHTRSNWDCKRARPQPLWLVQNLRSSCYYRLISCFDSLPLRFVEMPKMLATNQRPLQRQSVQIIPRRILAARESLRPPRSGQRNQFGFSRVWWIVWKIGAKYLWKVIWIYKVVCWPSRITNYKKNKRTSFKEDFYFSRI